MATKASKMQVTKTAKKTSRTKKVNEITPEQQKRIVAISNRIKELRLNTGLDYESFANAHGMHRVTFYNAERSTNITLSTLLKIVDAFDMTLEQFFKGLK